MDKTFYDDFKEGVISSLFYSKYIGKDKTRDEFSNIDVQDMIDILNGTKLLKAFIILRNEKPIFGKEDERDDTCMNIMLGINTQPIDLRTLHDDLIIISECDDYYHYFWVEKGNYEPDNMYFKINKDINIVDDFIDDFTIHAHLANLEWLNHTYTFGGIYSVDPIEIKYRKNTNYVFIFTEDQF